MSGRWPFVGRKGELARAEWILASGAGVLILGEEGIGKTALARRLAERAAAGGVAVIAVTGRAVSSGAPFEAFVDMLALPEPSQPSAAAVAARVRASAAGARLMLVVDDVDLLDDGSARVLLHLADAGSTVVATAGAAPLPGPVESLWRDGRCERLDLAGLTDDEAAELLETLLGGPPTPRRAPRSRLARRATRCCCAS